MALIENNISLDEKLVKRILEVLKNFINQPKWLLILLFSTITITACYFTYTMRDEHTAISDIYDQIEQINDKVYGHLDIDDYTTNLKNIIAEIYIIKHANDQRLDNDLAFIEAIQEYVKRTNPNDPVLDDLNAIYKRKQKNSELVDKEFNYVISRLNAFIDAQQTQQP